MTRKALISFFCVLNLFTVVFMNRNEWFGNPMGYPPWILRRYAHLVGLDNRWEMFSYAHRFNWKLVFTAKTESNKTWVLPIPFQSKRGFWNRLIFDFHAGKWWLNLYGSQDLRVQYSDFLCRTYPMVEGEKTYAIEVTLQTQEILDRRVAAEKGHHLGKETEPELLELFICR
ncbi:MAG: hypothetical protein JNL01_03415 [Bdellovibrionales bacterium]|nr:hypothetical protein [Bdellovibrionales bacterium]